MASTNTATADDDFDLPPPVTDKDDPYRTRAYVPTPAASLGVVPQSNAGLLSIWPPPGNTPGPMTGPNTQTSIRPDGTVVPQRPYADPRTDLVDNTTLALGAGPPANLNARTLAVPPQSSPGEVPAVGGNQGGKLPWATASPAIQAHESGGRNIRNATGPGGAPELSASGPWQIIDSTWKDGGKLAGVDVSQWAHAEDAPRDVQEKVAHALYDAYGMAPWKTSTNPDGSRAAPGAGPSGGIDFERRRQEYLRNNPAGFDPSSVNTELERLNQQRMAAEQPLIDARMRRQQKEEAEADDEYSELKRQRDLNNPALQPWTQKPPQADPISGLASLGSVFAALASAFSHTPGIAAMNGMAAAITARDEGNQKQYDEAFRAYQYNAQLALDRNAQQQHAYDAAWARVKENPELGIAELKSVAQIYDDQQTLLLAESGNLEKADEINRSRQEAANKWAIETSKLDEINKFGPAAGSEDAKEVEARTRELLALNPDMGVAAARAQANDELKKKNAELARNKTIAGSQLENTKADLRRQYPQATEGELDRRANTLLAELKKLGSSNPQTMTFLAAKQKHIDEGDSDGEATMKAYADIKAFGAGKPPDQDTLDFAAQVYLETGHMPPLGIGGSAIRTQILARAAQLAKDKGYDPADVIAIQSGVKADQATLTVLTKSRGSVGNFEGTAERELKLAESYMDKGAGPSGIPIVNRWIQAGRQDIQGDPDVTQFNTAMTSFKNEYAKIMSSPGGNNQQTTDAARREADDIINRSQTKAQLRANIVAMQAGMKNRINSIDAEINETQGRLRHPGNIIKPDATIGAVGPASAPPGVIRYDKQGNRIVDPPT